MQFTLVPTTVPANLVIRQVCDSDAVCQGYESMRYDGTPEDAIRVAEIVSNRVFEKYEDASNIQSAIIATNENGKPRWAIWPNFKGMEEIARR